LIFIGAKYSFAQSFCSLFKSPSELIHTLRSISFESENFQVWEFCE